MSSHYVYHSEPSLCSVYVLRTLVISGIAAVILAIVIYYTVKELRRRWKRWQRRSQSKDLGAYEDPVYLQRLELQMIRRQRHEAEQNIYESI